MLIYRTRLEALVYDTRSGFHSPLKYTGQALQDGEDLVAVNQLWSVRVGRKYRALAVQEEDVLIWFRIGTRDEYDRVIG